MISANAYRWIARVFCVAMIAVHLLFVWSVRDKISRGDPDFTAFYTAGRLLRSGLGSEIYDPAAQLRTQKEFTANAEIRQGPLRYIHPPFEALLFLPLAFLSYRAAFVVWDIANLGLVLALSFLLRRVFPDNSVRGLDLFLGLLAFFPIFVNFFQGQDAIVLLLVVAIAFRALQKHADFAAGCWLGAGLFRFQLVIPLVLILFLWGRRRVVAGFAATAAILICVSVAVAGWQATLDYPRYVWLWASVPGLGRTPPSLLPNLLGLFTGWPGLDSVSWLLRLAVLIASIGLLILVSRMKNQARDSTSFSLAFSCAILVSVLVGYNTSTYDLALLVLPVVASAEAWWRESPKRMTGLLLPVVILLVSPFWFLIGLQWKKFNLIAIFLLWWLVAMRNELQSRQAALRKPQSVALLT